MNRKAKIPWAIAGLLIIMALGIVSYKAGQPVKTTEEACNTSCKEQGETESKASLPMWESISRHLIMVQR